MNIARTVVISKGAQGGGAPFFKILFVLGAHPLENFWIDLESQRLCSQNSYNIK